MHPPAEVLGAPRFSHPDAIDTRLVFRIYAWVAIGCGLFIYAWPLWIDHFAWPVLPFEVTTPDRNRLLRDTSALMIGAGLCAAGFASVDDPVGRRRGLLGFAIAHLAPAVLWSVQAFFYLDHITSISPFVVWWGFIAGPVLLFAGITAPTMILVRRRFTLLGPHEASPQRGLAVDGRLESVDTLRSAYEDQIRLAARQEERARLARDLHDAVKQQLFVIQTAAATVEARLDSGSQGAKDATGQIRTAAREAVVEMQALIEQLQAAPMENVGLVDALKKQCEALGFRTGADVKLEIGELPPSVALPPGSQLALFRAAQEALANIGRHARARQVTVKLGKADDRLELFIRDNGVGFEPGEARGGMGIRNMTARAAEMGGSFTLRSSPGAGTSIRISVPCDSSSATEYGRKALAWAAFLAVSAAYWMLTGRGPAPWHIPWAGIVGIIVARYAVAYFRLRRRAV